MMTLGTIAKRAGRIAFGLVLIAGAVLLFLRGVEFHRTRELTSLHAWHVIVGAWACALTAGFAVAAIATWFPWRREADALRHAALWVPSVGVALMLPLTLHLIVMATRSERAFDEWTWLSTVLTTHTHVVFALCVYARARALTGIGKPMSVKLLYLVTCLTSAIPFVLPVLFVGLTGIAIVPFLVWMERIARIDRERSRDIPFAIARAV